MKILITTGSWAPALVSARSLAPQGHQVYLLSSDPYCAGFYSRYCAKGLVAPRERKESGYVDAVLNILSKRKYDLLIPVSDYATGLLSEERERILEHTRLLLPSKELISMARNKDQTYRFMEKNGVAIPRTHFPGSLEEVERLAEKISFPVVVKKPVGSSNQGNTYFYDKESLKQYYRNLPEEEVWPVMQEFVEGVFYGATAIVRGGEILDCFLYTARQEYARYGTPPYGESTVDGDFLEAARRLIKHLNWTGAINLDFIKTAGGEFKFLEINPRLPGSLGFSYALGLDLPGLYLDLALGRDVKKFQGLSYRPGVKFRFVVPPELIYALKNKRHFPKLLLNFLNPRVRTDVPWDDPRLLLWQLRHVWWYWRAKRHVPAPAMLPQNVEA